MAEHEHERGGRGGTWATVLALAAAVGAFAFQQTAVTPAIPTIERDFGASAAWVAWLLSGYLVASAVATPLLGKLGDRFGRRRMLTVSLAIFFAGSVGAALAPSLAVLVTFRIVQGAGGAVFPLALAIARDELPAHRVRAGIGALTGAFGVGTVAGFGLAGLIVEAASWEWIFAAGAVVVLVVTAVVPLVVPRSPAGTEAPLDLPGAALLTGGLALVLIGLTEGPLAGWLSLPVLGAFAAGALLLIGWIRRDLRTAHPLLDLRVLAARPVLLTNGASLLVGYVLFGVFFLIPFRADGPVEAGLLLLPAAIGQTLTGPIAGAIGERVDPRWPFAAGMALSTLGSAWLAAFHDETWQVAVATFVLGSGFGAAIGVASALVTQAVDASDSGIAAALNSVLRRVGGGFGSQVSAALLAGLVTAGGRPEDLAFTAAFLIAAVAAAAGTVMALAVRVQ